VIAGRGAGRCPAWLWPGRTVRLCAAAWPLRQDGRRQRPNRQARGGVRIRPRRFRDEQFDSRNSEAPRQSRSSRNPVRRQLRNIFPWRSEICERCSSCLLAPAAALAKRRPRRGGAGTSSANRSASRGVAIAAGENAHDRFAGRLAENGLARVEAIYHLPKRRPRKRRSIFCSHRAPTTVADFPGLARWPTGGECAGARRKKLPASWHGPAISRRASATTGATLSIAPGQTTPIAFSRRRSGPDVRS